MNKPRTEALSGDIAPCLEECLYFLDVCLLCFGFSFSLIFNSLREIENEKKGRLT